MITSGIPAAISGNALTTPITRTGKRVPAAQSMRIAAASSVTITGSGCEGAAASSPSSLPGSGPQSPCQWIARMTVAGSTSITSAWIPSAASSEAFWLENSTFVNG